MWLNKELYLFTMVISMPKENASKTTNVGLFYVNIIIIIKIVFATVTFYYIVIKSFINLFTMFNEYEDVKNTIVDLFIPHLQ